MEADYLRNRRAWDGESDAYERRHGAQLARSPMAWGAWSVPQVARLLRPGGVLAFSLGHPLREVFWDDAADAVTRTARRSYFDARPVENAQDGGVAHVRPVSTYVTLLVEHGFAIERLLEPRPSAEAVTSYAGYADLAWARDFPLELKIRARRREAMRVPPGSARGRVRPGST